MVNIEIKIDETLQVGRQMMINLDRKIYYKHIKSDNSEICFYRDSSGRYVVSVDGALLLRDASITKCVGLFNEKKDKPPRSDNSYYKSCVETVV